MNYKNNIQHFNPQILPAGISENNNIEFFGIPETKTVQWFQNGCKMPFKQLSPFNFSLLSNAYNQDLPAKSILKRLRVPYERQVELYTYYIYGSLDHTPDISNGKLNPSENYRHKSRCISLEFANKDISIDGKILNQRDLTILDQIAIDAPDKAIAAVLNITVSTLGFHKKNLFTKLNVQTKPAALLVAVRANIIN